MSLLVDLAEAVKDWINGGTYTAPFAGLTAVRTYKPRHERQDLETLQVSVVPSSKSIQMVSRGRSAAEEIQCYVGVAKAIDYTSNTAPDQMATLLEEIESRLKDDKSFSGATLQRMEYTTPERVYSNDFAEQHDVWFSVLLLSYKAMRI